MLITVVACGCQVQPVASQQASRKLTSRVAVGAVVTIEPRRRKFHRPITLRMPQPQPRFTNNTNTQSLRLLCSLAGSMLGLIFHEITRLKKA